MTAYLADTHIVLWAWREPERLSPKHRDILVNAPLVHVSIASIWEMAIKAGLGKLDVPDVLSDLIEANGFQALPVTLPHIAALRGLPQHHGDPFDRMLIAQARADGLTLITRDRRFAAYDVALA